MSSLAPVTLTVGAMRVTIAPVSGAAVRQEQLDRLALLIRASARLAELVHAGEVRVVVEARGPTR